MEVQSSSLADRWIQALRRNRKTTHTWACTYCLDRNIFHSTDDLWEHGKEAHRNEFPPGMTSDELRLVRIQYEAKSSSTRITSRQSRNTTGEDIEAHLDTKDDQPWKRAALGDGISAGSASPFRDSSASPPPRRSKARPTSAPYGAPGENDRDMYDIPRPSGAKKQLWTEHDTPLTRSSVQDQSDIASVQAQRARKALTQPKTSSSLSSPAANKSTPRQNLFSSLNDDSYDIILHPETRPISQEQLVAEVKGIYAGLVIVEAKCIEVDNKQAMRAQGTPQAQPKLNNEQWQALIALHRTMLYEHHDFFFALQHPSASPALRRLASKYALPTRMWDQSIHTFPESLRNRLGPSRLPILDIPLIQDHGLLFTERCMDRFNIANHEFIGLLDEKIGLMDRNFIEHSYRKAVANSVAMQTPLVKAISTTTDAIPVKLKASLDENSLSTIPFSSAQNLSNATFEMVLQRIGDPNALPFLHVTLVFLHFMSLHANAIVIFQDEFPWELLSIMLNTLLHAEEDIESSQKNEIPFPEDLALRGLLWADSYYPDGWFTDENQKEDNKCVEPASVNAQGNEGIHWLAYGISSALRFARSSFLGIPQKKTFRHILLLNQVFQSFRITAAVPISARTESQPESNGEGFVNYFAEQLRQFKDHISGPIAENTGYAFLFTLMYYGFTRCDKGWKGANLLEIATAITSSYSYFCGNGEWLSDTQVVLIATLNFCLIAKLLQKKLSKFPKTWMPTVFCIEWASLTSAAMLAKYMPAPGGRYENPWVQSAMLLPPMNLFYTACWINTVRDSGLAKHLEEGTLCTAAVEFFQKRLPVLLALLLILVLFDKL